MTTFIGAEYVIANCLIANKNRRVTLDELNESSYKLQKLANKENVDVIFLSSYDQVTQALNDFPEYFTYSESTKTIGIAKGKDVGDLKHRFMGFLPFNVLCFIDDTFRKVRTTTLDNLDDI